MSLALTDAQLTAITNVVRPLPPDERSAFMAQLFEQLIHHRHDVGDGELHRLVRDLQHRYFTPPSTEESGARWAGRAFAQRPASGV